MAGNGSALRGEPWFRWNGPLVVWGMFGLVTLAVLITYARESPSELYDVSQSGIGGGVSRALVYLNFPVAFVAIALIGIATVSLLDQPATLSQRRALVVGVAVLGVILCLVASFPGVVRQSDLDVRPINALPVVGVALGLALTIESIKFGCHERSIPRSWREPVTIIVAMVLFVLSLPWILADIGVYIGDIPIIDKIYMSKMFVPAGSTLPAVHLGHHHGLDGAMFVVSALILGRTLTQFPAGRLRTAISWYLALTIAYGVANFANDFWLEQIVKRGWTTWEIPNMLRPEVSIYWGLVLLGVVVARYVLFRPASDRHETRIGALSKSPLRGN